MTVSNNYASGVTAANGVTTVFSVSWNALSAANVVVQLLNTTTGVYTLVTQGSGAGQYQVTTLTPTSLVITFGTAPASGNNVVISRNTAQTQTIPYTTSRGFQGTVEEGSFDALTNMVQELLDMVNNSIQVSIGDTPENLVLPIASLRANQYLAFDASGNVIMTPGTGTTTSATLVYYTATGGIQRSVASKIVESISVADFGAKGDGTTDDTAAIQNAINQVQGKNIQLLLNANCLYRTTAPLVITQPLRIRGLSASWIGTPGTINLASVTGSVIYANHTGNAIQVTNAVSGTNGNVKLESFGIIRDQSAPAVSWTPNANNYDIYITGSPDTFLDDIFLINATKGIYNFGSGRLTVRHLRAECFAVGIYTDNALDTNVFDDVHLWTFWSNGDTHVQSYCCNNYDMFYFNRCDNPFLSNVFGTNGHSGMRFGQTASGITSRMHAVNIDFDQTTYGLWVDTTVTTNVTGQFDNLTINGNTVVSTGKGMYYQGGPAIFGFGNLRITGSQTNAIDVEYMNTLLNFAGFVMIDGWDASSGGNYAVKIGSSITNCQVNFALQPYFAGGNVYQYSAPAANLQQLSVPQWLPFTPTVTPGAGAITSYTTSCVYKYFEGQTFIDYNISLTNAGTASSTIMATLPIAAVRLNQAAIGGREVSLTGKMLSGTITAASTLTILNYDNSFNGATGANLNVGGMYR